MRWRSKRRKTEPRQKLGDAVESALSTLGITSERVEAWLGRPCRCRERKRKLNQLDEWVTSLISGKDHDTSRQEFDKMVGDGETSSPEVK